MVTRQEEQTESADWGGNDGCMLSQGVMHILCPSARVNYRRLQLKRRSATGVK